MADPGRLDELKRKFDENPRRYFAPLANEYRKAGQPDMAIELCRTYLPQHPSHMSGYIVYGQALHDAGRDEEAAAVFHQALSLDPENIIALRQLGDIARTSGDSAGAIQWYRRVLELDPRNEEISSFITALENPTAAPQRDWSRPERPAPPPVRPEPENHDGNVVALEDLVAQPEQPQAPTFQAYQSAAPSEPPLHAERSVSGPELTSPSHEEPAPIETAPFEPAAHEPQPSEPEAEEPLSPGLVEITFEEAAFEAVQWPAATPEEQRAADEHAHPDAPASQQTEPAHHDDTWLHGIAEQEGPSEPVVFSDYVPEEEIAPHAELVSPETAEPLPVEHPAEIPEQQAPASAPVSPFVTETMAELYLQQGLRAEALAIYRQLAARRDDPALRQRIAELEHIDPPATETRVEELEPEPLPGPAQPEAEQHAKPSGESVRAFFARIGARQPTAHAHIAAENASGLASLFPASAMDDGDIAAAQSLAGAFGAPAPSPRD
jgi:DNA-binding SARP family transcriptional activator